MASTPKISFFRGDSHTTTVYVKRPDPLNPAVLIPVDLTGATAYLSVKKDAGDPGYQLHKKGTITDALNGKVEFYFIPSDFVTVLAGMYIFDVQVAFTGGALYTVIRGDFDLREDLTKDVPTTIDPASLSKATANFVGPDGVVKRQKVLVTAVDPVFLSGSYYVTPGTTKVYESDNTGLLEFYLVRGAKVRVALESTNFIREFVVPNSPTFDLLQVMASAVDMFTVQTVAPLLTRRTL